MNWSFLDLIEEDRIDNRDQRNITKFYEVVKLTDSKVTDS